MFLGGWVDGWVGGWMGGWVVVKAVLRIAYSNQKSTVELSDYLPTYMSNFELFN
jgi:hypothetical protein